MPRFVDLLADGARRLREPEASPSQLQPDPEAAAWARWSRQPAAGCAAAAAAGPWALSSPAAGVAALVVSSACALGLAWLLCRPHQRGGCWPRWLLPAPCCEYERFYLQARVPASLFPIPVIGSIARGTQWLNCSTYGP